jgi:acid phosphatase type 7
MAAQHVRARSFGNPRPSGAPRAQKYHGTRSNQPFQPLPQPTGAYPYRLSLADLLPHEAGAISKAGKMVFHASGDTGGVMDPRPQEAVAAALEADLASDHRPLFFYHLGDVVYFNGERANYFPQFYEPYAAYTIPIVAIPGNHDGDVAPDSSDGSLAAFVDNFCATDPHLTPEAEEVNRHAMTQPNVYWTLLTPLATMIGLYTNCPEGGVIQNDQHAWLVEELAAADKKLPVIVTLHHPPYSVEHFHGGSAAMESALDEAFRTSGRVADAVFSGHVHNYQRFVRPYEGREIPYIVAGGGGYHNLHHVQTLDGALELPYQPPDVDAALAAYVDDRYGFMRVTVSRDSIKGEYVAVTREGQVDPTPADSWTLDVSAHKVS